MRTVAENSDPFTPGKTDLPAQSAAVRDVIAERMRQVEGGWSPEHDDLHVSGELAEAAAVYIVCGQADCLSQGFHGDVFGRLWPWFASDFKPEDRRRDLVRAAALLVAEIERLDRAALDRAQERLEVAARAAVQQGKDHG